MSDAEQADGNDTYDALEEESQGLDGREKKFETLCPGEDLISTSLHGVDSPVKVSAFIKRNVNLRLGCQ